LAPSNLLPSGPPQAPVITRYDYLNIGFYLLFIVGVGVYFARKSRNTSDYFRGGGSLPWWITGASAWMAAFSAWTFTGAAGKMYEAGPYAVVLFYQNVIATFLLLAFTCYRLRRMRVVTPFEAIRLRFGPGVQQFYTWVRLPVSLVFSSLGLNFVAVFMAAVFGTDLTVTLIVLGLIVTSVSMLGGSFGVAASDFVQMLLVVTVTITIAILALAQPAVGGVAGLIERAPDAHFDWGIFARPQFIMLWFIALTINTVFHKNSLSDESAAKYMMARSDRHARLTLTIPIIGTLLGPLVWLIPPMAAAITHPNLGEHFPNMKFPNEAAFLATAHQVLPQGMLGLLICGIFAATLTTMDAALNQGAGMFVRNFYLPVVNPHCSERKLLWLSKLATLCFGTIIITLAVMISRVRSLGLFDLLNQVGVSLLLPLAIPACLGIFYKRTPSWSAWSTVLIGFVVSVGVSMPGAVQGTLTSAIVAVSAILSPETQGAIQAWAEAGGVKPLLRPEMFAWIPGMAGPFKPEEVTEFRVIATVSANILACVGWFFFTSLFYTKAPARYRQSVDEFFDRMKTPLPDNPEAAESDNYGFVGTVGRLCFLYGGFITVLALIPNSLGGRLCYVCCGGVILVVGFLLRRSHLRHTLLAATKIATPTTPAPANPGRVG
jgi:solute:Na+ symporter, SSS family